MYILLSSLSVFLSVFLYNLPITVYLSVVLSTYHSLSMCIPFIHFSIYSSIHPLCVIDAFVKSSIHQPAHPITGLRPMTQNPISNWSSSLSHPVMQSLQRSTWGPSAASLFNKSPERPSASRKAATSLRPNYISRIRDSSARIDCNYISRVYIYMYIYIYIYTYIYIY